MPIAKYKDQCFEYEITRKKVKNISIRIYKDGTVRVSAPDFLPDYYIQEAVYERAEWILSKLKAMEELNKDIHEREYSRGDGVVYLGHEYGLKVIDKVKAEGKASFKEGLFEVEVNPEWDVKERETAIREGLTKWYKNEAFRVFKERTLHYSRILELYPDNIRVKEQKSIWGSCSFKGNINFNWRLIMAPLAVLDYVVVHELCHLTHRNHSRNFWQLVEQIMPDYKTRRKWLKDNGGTLRV